jgi:hypothetical protein
VRGMLGAFAVYYFLDITSVWGGVDALSCVAMKKFVIECHSILS